MSIHRPFRIPQLLLFALLLSCTAGALQAQMRDVRFMLDSARLLLDVDPLTAAAISTRAAAAAEDDRSRAEAEELLAEAYHLAGKNDAALRTYERAESHALVLEDGQMRARVLNGRGVVLARMNRYDRALEAHLRAIALFDSLGNDVGRAQALHDMARALGDLGETDEAWSTHLRALQLREQAQHRDGIAESLNSIGDMHRDAGRLDSALICYQRALTQQRRLGLLSGDVAGTLNDIGEVYLARGEVARAVEYFEEALRIAKEVGSSNLIAVVHLNIGKGLRRIGAAAEARTQLLEARKMARGMQLGRVLAEALQELSRASEQLNRPQEALEFFREAVQVRDSLAALVTPQSLAQAGALYSREREQRAREDYESSRTQDLLIFILIVAILLGAVALIALSLLRVKARSNRTLEMKNEEIREMNQQLSDLNHELARSEEKYRMLFERLPVGVFLYDSALTLLQFNPAFVEILDSTREKLHGLDMRLLRDNRILPALQAVFDGEVGSYEGEYLATTNDRKVDVAIRTAPLSYGTDVSPYGIGFVLDITNWKRIERELIESKELAEQADSLKHAFLTNISHEIRTPLNIIMGYFGLLQTGLRDRLSTEEADHFAKVDLAVRRLLRTVDQILNLSILEAGSYAINKEECAIAELVSEVVEELRPFAQEKGLGLSLRPASDTLRVTIDRYSVAQALRNILDNAVKFTDEGDITVSVTEKDAKVTLVVEDTGIGMTDQYIQRLYQSFSQEEDGYTRPYDGLGLGLTLTKRYIEVNDGTVSVRSRKGMGTMFMLELPLLGRSEGGGTEEKETAAAPVSATRPVILVVEDDLETQKFLRLILHSFCILHFAESAEDAWDMLDRERFDLILMDISLRGEEDGLQLTRRIRSRSAVPDIPIIAVTAHAFADDRRRSLEAGCSEYLPKPFRVKQLRELVERFVPVAP